MTEIKRPKPPHIEVIHNRDPDAHCDLWVFVDGKQVVVEVFDIDPGGGYLKSEWDAATDLHVMQASPSVAKLLRKLRDAVGKHSPHIERGKS